MPRSTLAAIVALCLALSPPLSYGADPPTTKPPDPKTEALRAEVAAFVKVYVDAGNKADAKASAELFSRKAGVTSVANGAIVRGWDAIRAENEGLVGREGSYKISIGAIDVAPLGGSYALAVAPFTLTVTTTSGTAQLPSAMTLVLEKSGSSWRLVHEHTSSEFQDSEPED